MTALEIASRIGFEESLMLEYFGGQYRDYMKKTGRLLPLILKPPPLAGTQFKAK
jgi:protein-S-isoprenylcysteine O-methyltransferase Ste14